MIGLDVEFCDVIRRAIASYARFGRAQHYVRVAEVRTDLTLEYPTITMCWLLIVDRAFGAVLTTYLGR